MITKSQAYEDKLQGFIRELERQIAKLEGLEELYPEDEIELVALEKLHERLQDLEPYEA